ncbi:TPA: hypothetical protein U2I61_003342 [Providencia rettgeri]|nr:hypothetical protein [Providencia rettgeri]
MKINTNFSPILFSLMVLILPLRFIFNGIGNLLLPAKIQYLALVFIIAIAYLVKKKNFTISSNQLLMLFTAIIIYFIIIINLNDNSDFSIEKSNLLIFSGFLYIFSPFILIFYKNNYNDEKFTSTMNFFILISVFLIISREILFSVNYSILDLVSTRNFLSLFSSPIEIINADNLGVESIPSGRTIGLTLVACILLSKFSKYKILIISTVFFFFLIQVGNRQSIIAALLVLFIYSSFKSKFNFLFFILLFSLVIYSFVDIQSSRFLDSGGERSDLIFKFIENLDKLSFFGNGINSFGEIYYYPNVYPHNISIEAIYELGVFFLILLYSLFVINYITFRKTKFKDKSVAEKFISLSIVYYLIVAHLSGDMYYNIILISLSLMYNILYMDSKHAY